MLQVRAAQKLGRIESALRNAAQRRGANVLAVVNLGQLLRDRGPESARDATVFTVCQPDLSAALLAADIRFAALVPCRIAAFEREGEVMLEALSPTEMCRLVDRPDLEQLAATLEDTLRGIMEEAGQSTVEAAQAHGPARHMGIGATEDQVSVRGSIPQRIDCHGTKVEELAGTGQHDAAGG